MEYMEITPITLVIRIIEFFAHIFLLSSILNKKLNRKEYALSTLIIVAIYELSTLVIPEKYKFIAVFFTLTIVVSLIAKISIYRVIVGYLITTVVILLVDTMGGILLFKLLDANKFQDIANYPIYYYLGMLMMSVLIMLSGSLIRYFKITFTNENDNKDIGIAFNVLVTLLFIFPSLSIIASYLENRPLSIENIVITIISMLAILVLSIFNSQKRYDLLVSEKELEEQKNYNVILQSLVDSLRTFKHDYNNTLATLYGYVQLNDIKSLKKMFKEILEESRQISSLDKLNPNLIKDPNVFGLVTAKYQECVKRNITMNFEIFAELENIEIKIYDLTRIMGIFLDNAIEAAGGSKEKKLNLLINENRGKVEIEISNTYSDKALIVEKIFEKGVSSKGKNRGLGLYKAKEIIKKYPGVQLKTQADKDLFMQKLIINKCM